MVLFTFFFLAPPPSNSQNILGTACLDIRNANGTPPGIDKWVYSRPPGKCTPYDTHRITEQVFPIVYTFQVSIFAHTKFLKNSKK